MNIAVCGFNGPVAQAVRAELIQRGHAVFDSALDSRAQAVIWFPGDLAELEKIAARADLLAPNLGVEAGQMLDWCKAFAGMAALEMPEVPGGSAARIRALAALAAEGE